MKQLIQYIWQRVGELKEEWNIFQATDKSKLFIYKIYMPAYYISYEHYHPRLLSFILFWQFLTYKRFCENFFL